jgi:hypothetical protein
MGGRIFINYRRGEDSGFVQALLGRLESAFASDQLFIDVDSIEPGVDFVRALDEQVAKCDILLAVIGKRWIDARDDADDRRLDNPEDFVRIEIAAALAQNKRVIPVLLGDAQMPRSSDLPDDIKALARRNAIRLTHDRFKADSASLVIALKRVLESIPQERRQQESGPLDDSVGEEQRRLQGESIARDELEQEVSTDQAKLTQLRRFARIAYSFAALVFAVAGIYWVIRTQTGTTHITAETTPPTTTTTSPRKAISVADAPRAGLPYVPSIGFPFGTKSSAVNVKYGGVVPERCSKPGSELLGFKDRGGIGLYFTDDWGLSLVGWVWPSNEDVLGIHLNDNTAALEQRLGSPDLDSQKGFAVYTRGIIHYQFDFDSSNNVRRMWATPNQKLIAMDEPGLKFCNY